MKPLFKFPGSKLFLTDKIINKIFEIYKNDKFDTYIECFSGSAALMFEIVRHFKVKKIVLIDNNKTIIDVFNNVKKCPDLIIKQLKLIENNFNNSNNKKDFYYNVRKNFNNDKNSAYTRTANFLFLNKTCFNGLMRFNSNADFNSPFGYKQKVFFDYKNIENCNKLFNENNFSFICDDFIKCQDYIDNKTFIYCDPPYLFDDQTNFINYSDKLFLTENHLILREFLKNIKNENVKFLLSGTDSEKTREIYKNFKIDIIKKYSCIAAKQENRKIINELLITL